MATRLLPRHKIIIDAYDEILHKMKEAHDRPDDPVQYYISLMDLYTAVAEATGYSPDYCGDIIRLHLRDSK